MKSTMLATIDYPARFLARGTACAGCSGSGDGAIAQLVINGARSLTCLDNSERMVEAARARLGGYGNVRFCHGDMHALPFADECFDNVMIFNALTYSAEPERVLAEATRVLRPGGSMVVVCLRQHEHADIAARYDHVNLGFSQAKLRDLHEAAGLTVISLEVCTRERRKPYFEVLRTVSVRGFSQ